MSIGPCPGADLERRIDVGARALAKSLGVRSWDTLGESERTALREDARAVLNAVEAITGSEPGEHVWVQQTYPTERALPMVHCLACEQVGWRT